jgi:hypothetical protein
LFTIVQLSDRGRNGAVLIHVGHGRFFQNLDGRSDHEVWRTEMALADQAEELGVDSVWRMKRGVARRVSGFRSTRYRAAAFEFIPTVTGRDWRLRRRARTR